MYRVFRGTGSSGTFGAADIDAMQDQRQIAGLHLPDCRDLARAKPGRAKAASLEPLREEHPAVVVPPQQPHLVAALAEEAVHVTAHGVVAQLRLDEAGQAVEGLAHVHRRRARQQLHGGRKIQHAPSLPRTWTTRANVSLQNDLASRTVTPLTITSIPLDASQTASDRGLTTTGTNRSVADVSAC